MTSGAGEPEGGAARADASGRALALPPAVARRFAGYEAAAIGAPAHRAFLIGRLLEEGEAGELRWLFAALGGEAVASWHAAHGGAALSRRSRAFWSVVLGVTSSPVRPLAHELWPLA